MLSDFKFFQGLEGNLNFTSTFGNEISTSNLTINNFKLNEAPALAKISLADLKGLTDTLKEMVSVLIFYQHNITQILL